VPCIIREISDDEVLALQIQANAISLETKPAEYAHQIKRMMVRDPDLTMNQVACLIRKSPSWVGSCLGLLNLLKDVQVMVDRGEVPLQNAYMLAKIPRSKQKDYVDKAKLMPAKEFRALAAAFVKQFTEAVKQGKMDAFYSDKFEAVAHLRSLKEVEVELLRRSIGALTCTGEGCQSVLDGFYAGLRWVCHLDRPSVREQEDTIRQRRERQVLDVRVDD
jgi:ParB-like chromosome segregation protein Spo0J